MFSKELLKDAAERAIATFIESLIAYIGGSAALISDVNWVAALSTAALATLLSFLKSIIASKKGDSDSASLIK